MRKNAYVEISYLEKINSLPKPIQCKNQGKSYRLTKLWMYNDDIIDGLNYYIVIDHLGNIYDTYWIRETYNSLGFSKKKLINSFTSQSENETSKAESIETVDAHVAIQSYQDRRFLWNVTANEGIAKVTFGVYQEQIQSLFYAREMPMSETGRKRPILHWVAAHQRRIKKGIEIDIEKHLRGINEFVYNGTKFTITQPLKKVKND